METCTQRPHHHKADESTNQRTYIRTFYRPGLDVPDSVCAAALSGWGLLATTVSRSWVATRMAKQHLRVFRELLSSADMDVRMEAGENLALLHESRIILGLVGDAAAEGGREEEASGEGEGEGEEEDMGDQDDDDGAAEMEAMDLTVLWEEVVEEIKGLITDSSKKVRFGAVRCRAVRKRGVEGVCAAFGCCSLLALSWGLAYLPTGWRVM